MKHLNINKFALTRILVIFLSLTTVKNSWSQNNKELFGAWVSIAKQNAKDTSLDSVNKNEANYLRFAFERGNKLNMTTHFAADGMRQDFTIKDNVMSVGFGRQFLIEKLSSTELVLVELEGEKLNSSSMRYWFVPEQIYFDSLSFKDGDRVLINDKTVYLKSKKLFPRFTNPDYPDFHLFMDAQIKNYYKLGENFYYVTFVLNPNGKIDNINILHHVNEAQDKKIIKAVKSSKGMWTIPKLNGKEVSIVDAMEDRQVKKEQEDYLDFSISTFTKYSKKYVNKFRSIVRNIHQKKYNEALKFIAVCEKLNPNEPNLIYLKLYCYEKLKNTVKAGENRELLKKTELSYLLKTHSTN